MKEKKDLKALAEKVNMLTTDKDLKKLMIIVMVSYLDVRRFVIKSGNIFYRPTQADAREFFESWINNSQFTAKEKDFLTRNSDFFTRFCFLVTATMELTGKDEILR